MENSSYKAIKEIVDNKQLDFILVLGPNIPPIGGVSNFINRFKSKVDYFNVPIEHIDINRCNYLKLFVYLFKLKVGKKKILFFYNNFDFITAFFSLLLFINFYSVFYDHNFRIYNIRKRKYLFKLFLRHYITEVWSVTSFVELEVFRHTGVHSKVVSPFIEPNASDEIFILESLPSHIKSKLNNSNCLIFSTSVYKVSYVEEIDLYGLDLCIELVSILKAKGYNVLLIIGISDDIFSLNVLESLKRKFNLSEEVLPLVGDFQLWPIIKRSFCFIRATFIDGDPLSIREALLFETYVLASNCVERINGVLLFENRNIISMYKSIEPYLPQPDFL